MIGRRTVTAIVFLSLAAFLVGCGRLSDIGVGPLDVKGAPASRLEKPCTAEPVVLAGPIPIEDVSIAGMLFVRSRLNAGAYELGLTVDGVQLDRRRIERIGENLTVLPFPEFRSASVTYFQVANSGALDVEFQLAKVMYLEPKRTVVHAREKAREFEAETGQLADPLVENMVPNASFAADDEVRGTPADWFAYVETEANVIERRLHVWGVAPGPRPYLATGPMRIESGRRYRILVRMTVREGSVAIRVADYEELRTITDLGTVSAVDGAVERRIDFQASDPDRAARIRFEPLTAGASADFELSLVQMELLP